MRCSYSWSWWPAPAERGTLVIASCDISEISPGARPRQYPSVFSHNKCDLDVFDEHNPEKTFLHLTALFSSFFQTISPAVCLTPHYPPRIYGKVGKKCFFPVGDSDSLTRACHRNCSEVMSICVSSNIKVNTLP